MKREINRTTNSFYTEEEYQQLTENQNFSWSNASNRSEQGYDNCVYKYENGVAYDIEARSNGFVLQMTIPGLFDGTRIWETGLSFQELQDKMKLSLKNKLFLSIYKLNSMIFGFFWLVAFSFYILFINKDKDKWTSYEKRVHDIYGSSYFYLKDALPFVWGMNLLFSGILITYLIMK